MVKCAHGGEYEATAKKTSSCREVMEIQELGDAGNLLVFVSGENNKHTAGMAAVQ